MGPKTEPCGTPLDTSLCFDFWPSTMTACFRLEKCHNLFRNTVQMQQNYLLEISSEISMFYVFSVSVPGYSIENPGICPTELIIYLQ